MQTKLKSEYLTACGHRFSFDELSILQERGHISSKAEEILGTYFQTRNNGKLLIVELQEEEQTFMMQFQSRAIDYCVLSKDEVMFNFEDGEAAIISVDRDWISII
jgi:hypothetical protein